jgi:predicted CopG family antitoxin
MPYEGWKTVAVRDEVYAKLKKKAEKEHRSLTNMVEVILLEAVEKHS